MAKQKNLKKTIKNNKKKKFSFKKLDFKKNWKKLSYGGALSLLLFTSLGFGGYSYVKNTNLEAEAAGRKVVGSRSGVTISGCRISKSHVSYRVVNNSWSTKRYSTTGAGGGIRERNIGRFNIHWASLVGTHKFYVNGVATTGNLSPGSFKYC